jgi:dihydroneopterin aldolase
VAERGDPVLVVPGGGPFADVVRRIDNEIALSPDASHWMAILAMNQYAELLTSLVPRTRLVETTEEIRTATESGYLPVLAPYRWLRSADSLRHSWDITSDSIAAWVAGELAAVRLVLVKAAKADRPELVDPYFERVLPSGLELVITDAEGCGAGLGL